MPHSGRARMREAISPKIATGLGLICIVTLYPFSFLLSSLAVKDSPRPSLRSLRNIRNMNPPRPATVTIPPTELLSPLAVTAGSSPDHSGSNRSKCLLPANRSCCSRLESALAAHPSVSTPTPR